MNRGLAAILAAMVGLLPLVLLGAVVAVWDPPQGNDGFDPSMTAVGILAIASIVGAVLLTRATWRRLTWG